VVRAWGRGTDRIVQAFERAGLRADEERLDARTIPGDLSAVLSGVLAEFGRLLDREGELVPVGMDEATARANGRAIMGQLGAVIAVDPIAAEPWLGPAMEAWRASNVALIGGLGPRHAAEVEAIVGEAWKTGKRAEWIQRELEGRLGITRRRAELIARDQVGKLNGQLTMLRQSAYGVEGYIWRTSLDERVRQMHADRDGERFEWSTPPEDGHPGMPIQCRCVAEPDIQDQLDELERLGEEELEYGQPDEELLRTAIDDLGQWQPDEGLVRRLKEEATAGLALTLPRGGAVGGPVPRPVRPVRQPVKMARTVAGSTPTIQQAQSASPTKTNFKDRKDERRRKEAAKASDGVTRLFRTGEPGPLPDIDTSGVVRPPIVRGQRPSSNPPAGTPRHTVPPAQVAITRDGRDRGDIDALTAEGFEEHKRASGLVRATPERRALWIADLELQLDNTIFAIEDFNEATDALRLAAGKSRGNVTVPSLEQIRSVPRRYTVLLADSTVDVMEEINVALDKLRAYNRDWTVIVASENS
jgi:SPP1 gp7 family putative phage head morphogenesis protein